MLSTKEIIAILKKFKAESASKYGITSLGLFGSFARNQQRETSDVDVFVTLKESDFFILERIKEELESLIHSDIDIVNYRDSLRNSFKQNILNDAIYV
jgi:predicted nucleotidyltransferase